MNKDVNKTNVLGSTINTDGVVNEKTPKMVEPINFKSENVQLYEGLMEVIHTVYIDKGLDYEGTVNSNFNDLLNLSIETMNNIYGESFKKQADKILQGKNAFDIKTAISDYFKEAVVGGYVLTKWDNVMDDNTNSLVIRFVEKYKEYLEGNYSDLIIVDIIDLKRTLMKMSYEISNLISLLIAIRDALTNSNFNGKITEEFLGFKRVADMLIVLDNLHIRPLINFLERTSPINDTLNDITASLYYSNLNALTYSVLTQLNILSSTAIKSTPLANVMLYFDYINNEGSTDNKDA